MTSNGSISQETIPEWIVPSLFETIFKKIVSKFLHIKEFKAIPALSAGENYATLMLRLEAVIELADGSLESITLMLKTAHESEASKELMKSHNVFAAETIMYQEVIPELEKLYKEAGVDIKFAPKFYELPTKHPHILLENLTNKGYKNMNRLEGFDIHHTQAVLKVLAQWHAASAVRVAKKGKYKYFENFFKEENREMITPIFNSLTDVFLKCAKEYAGHEKYYESLYSHQNAILDDIFEANQLNENEFNVLNHGDCWSNNIMFKHDETDCIIDTYLLDYQIPHFGTPAQDLYYLLLSSTKYELKIDKFDYFIKYYYDCLKDNLMLLNYPKKCPSLKDIHIMLHKYNAWAYNASTGVMAAVLLDPSDKAKLDNYLTDSDDAVEFKLQLYTNPRYRKHMELVLPWLYYRGAF